MRRPAAFDNGTVRGIDDFPTPENGLAQQPQLDSQSRAPTSVHAAFLPVKAVANGVVSTARWVAWAANRRSRSSNTLPTRPPSSPPPMTPAAIPAPPPPAAPAIKPPTAAPPSAPIVVFGFWLTSAQPGSTRITSVPSAVARNLDPRIVKPLLSLNRTHALLD